MGIHDAETVKQRAKRHRAYEREHVKQVRYYVRNGLYAEAAKCLAWAMRAATAASVLESEVDRPYRREKS